MQIFKQREICSMSPATFSLLSFTDKKGNQPSMMLFMLFSPTFSGAPSNSNTLALTPLFSDQTGKKASQCSGSIFTICFPHCLMLDSTHLERKDWGKIGVLLPATCLQLMALTIPCLSSANSYLNQSLTEIW